MEPNPNDAAIVRRFSAVWERLCVLPTARTFPGAILALVLGSSVLWAEGYAFKDGHFDFPEVTRLTLTDKQARLLEKRFKPGIKISLTKAQIAQIRAEAGVKEAPTKLQIYKVENLEGDCACGLLNFAIIIAGGRIEMPHYQVVSDREAAEYE
jgi:hypothetical protein